MRCFRLRPARPCRLTTWLLASLLTAMVTALIPTGPGYAFAQDKPASSSGSAQVSKVVGVIKTIHADSIRIAAESGGELTATLAASTKIMRVPPGEKDLKNATALQAEDLQPGDRVLVRGQASTNQDTIPRLQVFGLGIVS